MGKASAKTRRGAGRPLQPMLDAVRDVAATVVDLDHLLAMAAQQALDLSGAEASAVQLADGTEMVVAAAAGFLAGSEGLRFAIGASLSGECLTLGEPVVTADVLTDRSVDRAVAQRLGIRSMIALPLRHEGRRIGILQLASSVPNSFSTRDAVVLSPVIDVLSARVDRLLAQEAERSAHAALADAHEALARNLVQQAALVESVDAALLLIDAERDILLMNSAAPRLLGLSRAQLLGTVPLPEGFHYVDEHGRELSEAEHPTSVVLRTGIRLEGVLLGVRQPGVPEKWLRHSAIPIPSELGQDHIAVTYRDVTEKQQLIATLTSSERMFRAVLDASPIAMMITGLDTRVTRANTALSALVGIPADELIGRLMRDLMDQELLDGEPHVGPELLSGNKTSVTLERAFRHADGRLFWTELQASLLRDDQGEPEAYIVQVTDITGRREERADLVEQAQTDALTGLGNRRVWDTALHTGARLAADGVPVAVAILDHDHFKDYNDTHGHLAGDALLHTCATLWTARLRDCDVLTRIGGEEFGLLLPGPDLPEAEQILRRLTTGLPEGRTVSVGVTRLVAGETPLDAVGRADAALYRAKALGRARVVTLPWAASP